MKNALMQKSVAFAAALLLSTLAYSPARAQNTTFTYQGLLDDAGAPASGLHDFRFRLFSLASGGAQIGSTLCVDNVNVVAGVFTTQLDFGQQYATTAQRHLEIDVRRDTGLTCANATGFVLMSPRQQLTATPMASHANSAFALDAADGSPANAVFVDNSGNVGIGTTAPATKLHVKTDGEGLRIDGSGVGAPSTAWVGFRDSNGTRTGYVGDGGSSDNSVYLTSDAGDVHLYTALGAAVTAKSDGKVGIGTTTPSRPLHVRADEPVLILQDPGSASTQSGYLGFWNGSSSETGWVGFGTPGSPHFSVVNARSGGNIALLPGPGGVVSVPVLEITGADLAERFPSSDAEVESGTVMEIDPRDHGKLRMARGAYNRRVAGVVSGANDFAAGAILGNLPGQENTPAIALSGRVYVLCDATSNPIQPGDLLTTSETPGHAMKAANHTRAQGAILGKAMTALESGRGTVLVLVSLQ